MSTALAEVVTEPTLAELAETANREHASVQRVLSSALDHAFHAGEALLAARGRIGRDGSWTDWLTENFDASIGASAVYMRLAYYRDRITASGHTEMNAARVYVRGLPQISGAPSGFSEEDRTEARRLRDAGVSDNQIAKLLGVRGHGTVRRWLDPEEQRKASAGSRRWHQQKAAQRKAKAEARRDESVRKIGGSVAESYSMIRKTLQALDHAHADQTDREIRAALSAATAKLHSAEDEIVRALGIS